MQQPLLLEAPALPQTNGNWPASCRTCSAASAALRSLQTALPSPPPLWPCGLLGGGRGAGRPSPGGFAQPAPSFRRAPPISLSLLAGQVPSRCVPALTLLSSPRGLPLWGGGAGEGPAGSTLLSASLLDDLMLHLQFIRTPSVPMWRVCLATQPAHAHSQPTTQKAQKCSKNDRLHVSQLPSLFFRRLSLPSKAQQMSSFGNRSLFSLSLSSLLIPPFSHLWADRKEVSFSACVLCASRALLCFELLFLTPRGGHDSLPFAKRETEERSHMLWAPSSCLPFVLRTSHGLSRLIFTTTKG